MRVVFISHNDLGFACLEELEALGADIRAIVTRPQDDDIADQTDFSTLAARADAAYLEVDSVNSDEVADRIASHEPDLLFVVGWSRLVDQHVLDIPRVAALGMHPAPLPRGRGRAPIAWNLIKGLDATALSFFHLVPAADAGDLVGQRPIDIDIEDDAASLYSKVVEAGRDLIQEYYPRFADGEVPRSPQDESQATWWPKRTPAHGRIDWRQPPMTVYNWIRGQSHPYPGAFSSLDGHRVTVWEANPPSDERVFTRPGEIRGGDGSVLRVGVWEGEIEVTRLQVDDGPEIPAGQLLDHDQFAVGDVFEPARADASPDN